MSKKILVVEDEKNIAELERDYLEANGYTVEIEFDGKNGLDKAIGSDYDLVILDVMLPGIDGFEVCRQIRKHKECPVLMVSASARTTISQSPSAPRSLLRASRRTSPATSA